MLPQFKHFRIYIYCIWLICFGILIWHLSYSLSQLKKTSGAIEAQHNYQSHLANKIRMLAQQLDARSKEIAFIHSLTDILPQEKNYLRTQKVISDEVQMLRKQIQKYLGNQIHIVVDTKTNKLFFKKGLNLLWEADCSVGRGGILIDKSTGRRWEFVTPKGEFKVHVKIKNPVWTKPDWAFVESNEPIPPPNDPLRKVEGELGGYVLNLGDGILIHGTKNEALLGTAVSHGCVRLGAENLEKIYQMVPVGTKVYIY